MDNSSTGFAIRNGEGLTMTDWDGLPQHWIRDTQPHIYLCPLCKVWVSKWHEHHGPSKERMWKVGKD